jgi:hypothetical protein
LSTLFAYPFPPFSFCRSPSLSSFSLISLLYTTIDKTMSSLNLSGCFIARILYYLLISLENVIVRVLTFFFWCSSG